MATINNLFFRSIPAGIIAASATLAVPAQESASLLEEIIVTAEKRSESLQDLSQAVTALSGEDIDNRNLTTFVDLSSIAPGVTVAKNEGFKTVISIRGVGNETNQNAIANPSVSYHLDGIYVASPFALHTDFLDLERIELLRGPQGTLFGQNSTGGAINVITKAPDTEEFTGKADVTVGNYNLVRARGSVNIPISATMALRASAASHNHEGFSKNITLDQGLDQADNFSGRARLLWAPVDNLRFNLTAQYYDEDTNGAAQKGILDSTPNPRRLTQDWHSSYELESQLYSLVAEWDLPAFTVRSLTSYQDDDIAIVRDNDRHDFVNLDNQGIFLLPAIFDPETNRQKTFTQELNLISSEPLFGRLDWTAGVFYLDTEVDILIREYIDFSLDGVYGPGTVTVEEVLMFGGEVGFISDSKPERDSLSVYGQGTFHLADSLRLVAGLRYTEDEVYSEVTNYFGREGTDILEVTSEKLTGRGVVEFDLNDDTMVYASYTRGFKPGGSNLTFGIEDVVSPILVLPTFKDETIEAWELGIKTDFANNRVRLNAAGFYYDYKNLQYQATDPEVFNGGVGNLPSSEIYGAELELLGFITDRLTLDTRLSWLETEITGSHLALDNVQSETATNILLGQGAFLFGPEIERARAAVIMDVDGNKLAKTPQFTADVMLRYRGRLGGWSDFEASAQYIYRDGFQHRIFNNPRTDDVPSYDVVNLMLTLAPDAYPWHIDLMGMNLADEDGINARFTDVFGVGSTGDELIAPRQYMVRFGMEF